jgi:cell division protein FtsL
VNAIASIAEGMPAHLEILISKLERKCKEQEKETPDLEKSVAALLKLQMN